MYSPHDPECGSADLIERLLPGEAFPENDTPGEDVTLLRVFVTFEHFWRHPGGAALRTEGETRLSQDCHRNLHDLKMTSCVEKPLLSPYFSSV